MKADEFPLAPVETRQPFLRAVLDLEPMMRKNMVRVLKERFPEKEKSIQRSAFIDSILLMLRY